MGKGLFANVAGAVAAPFTGGLSLLGTDLPGEIGDAVGPVVDDFMNSGKNRFDGDQHFDPQDPMYGGDPSKAGYLSDVGLGQTRQASDLIQGAGNNAQWMSEAMRGGYGPQEQVFHGQEDQGQVANEYASRGIQSNALGLAQSAAQGNQPSAAQYMMNSGLNTAMANQQAIAGGARGAGAMALAGGNMAGNNAALQSQAFNQGGQMRAQEMAQARDMYGNLSTQQRGQDQSRIGQGNQLSEFNAGQSQLGSQHSLDRDVNFRTGMANGATGSLNAGSGAINAGTGALGQAMHPFDQQLTSGTQMMGIRGTSFDAGKDRAAGISSANAAARAAQGQKPIDAFTGMMSNGLKAGPPGSPPKV